MHWPTTIRNYAGVSVARQKGLVSSKTFEKKIASTISWRICAQMNFFRNFIRLKMYIRIPSKLAN